MKSRSDVRSPYVGIKCTVLAVVPATTFAAGTAWMPSKNVEIVLNTAAGSGQDASGCTMQKIMQEHGLVVSPIVVINKPGGENGGFGQVLAWARRIPHVAPQEPRFLASHAPSKWRVPQDFSVRGRI